MTLTKLKNPLVIISMVTTFISCLLLILTASLYQHNQLLKKQLTSLESELKVTQETPEDTKALLAEISTFMDLPKNEDPTVATVINAEELKTRPFFQKSQNGDRVVVYAQSGKAILYRQTEKRIIEIGVFPTSNSTQNDVPNINPKPINSTNSAKFP